MVPGERNQLIPIRFHGWPHGHPVCSSWRQAPDTRGRIRKGFLMRIKVVGLGLLVAAASLVVPAGASAGVHFDVAFARAGRPLYVGDSGYRSRDAGRYGFERGYREGADEGYADGRKGRRFDFVSDGDFRDADDGYKGWMGSRHVYANGFQRGFAEGYRRAFEQGRRERRAHDAERRGHNDHDYRGDDHDRW